MALVLSESCCNASIASAVGRMSNLISRRAASRFTHHREPAVSAGANDQAAALPGYFFPDRERCMTEGVTEFLGRFFLPLMDVPMIDHLSVAKSLSSGFVLPGGEELPGS